MLLRRELCYFYPPAQFTIVCLPVPYARTQALQLQAYMMFGTGLVYRVSIKSFPDYKHLLKENYVEYKLFFFKSNKHMT